MSKHHHQSKAEQINNRARGAVTFHRQRASKYARKPTKPQDVPAKAAVADGHSVRLRAYQIYQEKGGPALENWLEAEQNLSKSHLR